MGIDPTTAASTDDGVIGFMNAALGLRLAPDFFAAGFFAGAFFAAFFAGAFFAAGFFAGFFAAGFFAGFRAAFLAVAMFLLPRDRCGLHCIERSEAGRPVTVIPAPSAATIAQFRGKGIPRKGFFHSVREAV